MSEDPRCTVRIALRRLAFNSRRSRLSPHRGETMAPTPSETSRLWPWLMVVTASATLLVPATTAEAEDHWRISSNTLIEYRDVCRDGIRFGGAVRDTAGPGSGSYKNRAIVVQPVPTSWEDWQNREGEVMNSPLSIPRKKDSLPI